MGIDKMDRRAFLKLGGAVAAGSMIAPVQMLLAAEGEDVELGAKEATRWAMVADVDKCKNCDSRACEEICRVENNVPYYGDPTQDAYWLRIAKVQQELPGVEAKQVPLLCQHCEDPPCVHVCPVAASFKRADGIVLVDMHRCIGCRYCMIACPYKARSFIVKKNEVRTNSSVPKMMDGVATKCTFCVHRVDKGQLPACVEKCPEKALQFGDMNDPESDVAKSIASGKTTRLRSNLKTGPKVFYIGL